MNDLAEKALSSEEIIGLLKKAYPDSEVKENSTLREIIGNENAMIFDMPKELLILKYIRGGGMSPYARETLLEISKKIGNKDFERMSTDEFINNLTIQYLTIIQNYKAGLK